MEHGTFDEEPLDVDDDESDGDEPDGIHAVRRKSTQVRARVC